MDGREGAGCGWWGRAGGVRECSVVAGAESADRGSAGVVWQCQGGGWTENVRGGLGMELGRGWGWGFPQGLGTGVGHGGGDGML